MRVNNVGSLRAKAVPKIGKEFVKEVKREQFNSIINSNLATEVKVMAQRLGVPGYALLEHLLQIGCYCLVKAEQDPASLETIQEHLVSHHLLGVAEPEDVRWFIYTGASSRRGDTDLTPVLVSPFNRVQLPL